MSDPGWNEYGGDPVPGDPANVQTLIDDLGMRARSGSDISRFAAAIGPNSSGWTGEAATKGRELIDKLTPELRKYADAHAAAKTVLAGYLEGYKQRTEAARQLLPKLQDAEARRRQAEARLSEQQRQAAVASSRERSAATTYQRTQSAVVGLPGVDPSLERSRLDWQQAQQVLSRIQSSAGCASNDASSSRDAVGNLRRQADSLRQQQGAAAVAAAAQIRNLLGEGFHARGVLDMVKEAYHATSGWLDDHVTLENFLKTINLIQNVVSILALVAAFIPGLQVVAGALELASLALSVTALLTTAFLAANHRASWGAAGWQAFGVLTSLLPLKMAGAIKPRTFAKYVNRAGYVSKKGGFVTKTINNRFVQGTIGGKSIFNVKNEFKALAGVKDTLVMSNISKISRYGLVGGHLAMQVGNDGYSLYEAGHDVDDVYRKSRKGVVDLGSADAVLDFGGNLSQVGRSAR